jgi:hypothetical protein
MDISMKAFNNARERDAETWISLFKRADDRFIFKDMIVPAESPMAIVVAEWAGWDASGEPSVGIIQGIT